MDEKKILVVDDEYVTRAMVEDMLTARGYTIVTAPDGARAIDRAVWERPDLILLDIVLPDRDGFSVLAELKKNETTRDIPVIFLSALSRSQAFDSEAVVAFIHKPINTEELLSAISSAIGRTAG
jgi:CheY-like chemotaxis protein